MISTNGWTRTLSGMPHKGASAERTRHVGQRDVGLFTEITGDRNPLHFDADAARESVFGGLIVLTKGSAVAPFIYTIF